MKRNLILSIAVAAIMMATTVAQAADVSFGGEFRPRYNVDNDSNNSTSPDHWIDQRVRLNARAKVNANTEVFLQFQSVGTFGGDEPIAGSQNGTRVATGGGTSTTDATANQASDTLDDVGFHQAHLTLKNFVGQAVDVKIGRQEVVIDGHRLFGHTGWTQGAETKDAIRLNHAAGNHSLNYTYIKGAENDVGGNANTNSSQDYSVHVLHASTQGIMGGTLSGIFTLTNDDDEGAEMADNEQWYTLGVRQKGKMGGLDYRVEFYHQFGNAGTVAATDMGITGANSSGDASSSAVDRNAQMFGVRLGKTFKNVSWKPSVTLWFDSLTGQDDDDGTNGDWAVFDTMYDTGHKFYGFQDFYLNRTGASSGFYGLQDIAVKTKMSPSPGWTIKADYHHFRTQTDISGGDADTTVTADASLGGAGVNAPMDPDMGSELDLTLVHKYDSNTKIVAGFSRYWTSTTFAQLNGAGGGAGANSNDDSDWAYVQVHTKF